MKIQFCLRTLIAIIMSVSSFSAVAIEYKNIQNIADRIETPAYSILAPQETGWLYSFENPIKILLGKSGSKEAQTFTGMVTMSRLPRVNSKQEFFELVSKQRARDSKNARYEDLFNNEDISTNNGLYIFHFHTKYRDYNAKNLPIKAKFLIVEDFGAVMQHPYNPGITIYIALSQRAKEEDLRGDFEKLAEEFLSNIKFQEFNE